MNDKISSKLDTHMPQDAISVVIPAFNEALGIRAVLDQLTQTFGALDLEFELVVIDDCSTDETAAIAAECGATVLQNLENGGYGYSLIRGIRHARHPHIAIVDADGSYPVESFTELMAEYKKGFAMVVGRRHGEHYVGSTKMRLLRGIFRGLAQFITGRSIPDVNSGMRIFRRDAVLPLLPHVSYGFSFTTSITLLFMMQALPVTYVPISYLEREGSSKVRYFRDSLRALQIIASITVRLNPIKLFLLCALLNFVMMIPLLLLAGVTGSVATVLTLATETSAILVGLGFVVEALIPKPPLSTKSDSDA